MIKDSFISLPKERVIKLCERTIAHINKRRQTKDDKYLNDIIQRKNKSWFRRLMGKPKVTLDQIKEEEEKYNCWPYYPSVYSWGTLDTAKRVLGIAKASDDVVFISSSDFRSIS